MRRSGLRQTTRGARLLAWLRALPDHRLTDRLVRGRAWIVVVGFLLIGIVAMQVTLLKLNSGIGRSVAQSANLERRNGELRATVSRLSAEERVQSMGAKLGLLAPDAGRVTYLTPRGGKDGLAAAQALRAKQTAPSTTLGSARNDGAAPAPDTPPAGDQAATPISESPSPDSGGAPAPDGAAADSPVSDADQSTPTDSASAAAGAIAAPGR